MAYKDKGNAIKYNNQFIKQAYDRINLTVPKGRKAELQAAAERRGLSVNGFINALIDEALSAGVVSIFPGGENHHGACSCSTSHTDDEKSAEGDDGR